MKQHRLFKYGLNILLMTLFLILIGIILQFKPFGDKSMLTIDLGQQYIDFFSLYKDTLTTNPEHFIYSFQKGFGGEMIGLWAYYLLSPFNLIFLLFNESNFHLGVVLISYLKIVASSLSMMYLIEHETDLSLTYQLSFSFSYALMGYVVVYLLNIMWLDGVILLPLIATGLKQALYKNKPYLYVGSLSLLFIANYYIGFMTSIFLVFYAWFVIYNEHPKTFKERMKEYFLFIKYSIISALISSIILVPTFMALLNSKSANGSFQFNWNTAHSIIDVFAKSFIGSFVYDEISSGSPNIYASLFVLLTSLFYFLTKKIHWKEKLVSAGILSFFLLSYYFEFLDKIWHGGQFPIWYHFRFSFLHSFFTIILAIRAVQFRPNQYTIRQIAIGFTFITVIVGYYFFKISDYPILTDWKLLLSLLFLIVYLLWLDLPIGRYRWQPVILMSLVMMELLMNTTLTLTEFNYVNAGKFEDYTQTLIEAVDDLKHDDNEFYRIHKTYMRTKNEAFYAHYDGVDHFGSTIEAHVPELYGYLGLPDGSGFIAYSNGTLFTDDFFNIKYLLNPTSDSRENTAESEYVLFQEAVDLDIQAYPLIHSTPRYEVYENEERFGLGIEVDESIQNSTDLFVTHNPIYNQNQLLKLIDFNGPDDNYFKQHSFDEVTYHGLDVENISDNNYFKYTPVDEDTTSYVRHTYQVPSTNPFYFTLPSQITSKNASFKLNDENYRIYTPFRHRQITNASFNDSSLIEFDMIIKQEMEANLVNIYEFDLPRYEKMVRDKQPHLFNVESFSPLKIEGTIQPEKEKSHLLFTIPYDSHWKAKIDGQNVPIIPVLNETLMSIPITSDTRHITLSYQPTSLYIGMGISIIGLFLLYLDRYFRRHVI